MAFDRDARAMKMQEIMDANDLNLIDTQRRLYSFDSLRAGRQDAQRLTQK